jgi:hypothetical protein
MMTGYAVAKSKQPPISPNESGKPNAQQSCPNTAAPTNDKCGNDEIPLTVKILPGQKTEPEAGRRVASVSVLRLRSW